MAISAQCSQVFNFIRTTVTFEYFVVNVNCNVAALLAQDNVLLAVSIMLEIVFNVLFHVVFYDNLCTKVFGSSLEGVQISSLQFHSS